MKSSCRARTQQQGAGEDEKQAVVRQDQGFEGGGADAPVRIPADMLEVVTEHGTDPLCCNLRVIAAVSGERSLNELDEHGPRTTQRARGGSSVLLPDHRRIWKWRTDCHLSLGWHSLLWSDQLGREEWGPWFATRSP